MVIIRPTLSLAKRLKLKLGPTAEKSTTRLGDWYAIDLVLNRRQFILSVSSTTRLGVMIEAAPYLSFPTRLPNKISELILEIGVKDASVTSELTEMKEVTFAKTEDRSIIGSMNDYRRHLHHMVQVGRFDLNNPISMSLWLSAMPSLVMEAVFPQDATLMAFGQPPLKKLVKSPFLLVKPSLFLVK